MSTSLAKQEPLVPITPLNPLQNTTTTTKLKSILEEAEIETTPLVDGGGEQKQTGQVSVSVSPK
jgi:hypothetical protein